MRIIFSGPKFASGLIVTVLVLCFGVAPSWTQDDKDTVSSLEKSKQADQEAPYAGFEVAEPERQDHLEPWSGPEMSLNLTGLAAGDVTGDGRAETVLLDKDNIYIYRLDNNEFKKINKIEAPGNTVCIAVDAGDINNDGKAEIFITAQNNRGDMLRSFVLEFQDGQYQKIAEKQPWFFRVVQHPKQGDLLLGQGHKLEDDPFQAEVVVLEPDNKGGYESVEVFLEEGQNLNVSSLALGSFKGQKDFAAVGITDRDRLQVVADDGSRLWMSREEYGGSTLFMQGPSKGQGTGHERFFLPGRNVAFQQSGDGDKLFSFRNKGLSPVRLQRLRAFDEGELVSLGWDGHRLQEEWKTRSYEGHFRDMVLADLTDNGKKELAALLIESEGRTFFSSPASRVLVFPLQADRKK